MANLVDVFREVKRVLRDDGVCWLNLGDSYSGSWGNYNPGSDGHGGNGQRSKDTERLSRPAYDGVTKHRPAASYLEQGNQLCIPERVVLALQADGWIKRDTIIWAKKSAMPESLAGWRWERIARPIDMQCHFGATVTAATTLIITTAASSSGRCAPSPSLTTR